MPSERQLVPQPWSKLQRENVELLEAVAQDGLTAEHTAAAQRLSAEAAASGAITPDLDARTALREIIRYWSAVLSLLDDGPTIDLSLHDVDPTYESSGPACDTGAPPPNAPRVLRDAISGRRALADVLVRDATLEASKDAPLVAHDVSLVNCRLVGGAWRHVELHGDKREWKETSFASVVFEHVVADRINAADTLWDGVKLSFCQFEDNASFESCVIRTSFTAEETSFQGASFRSAKLVPSVEAQTDGRRSTFDLTQPAPLVFRQCNLSGVSFDRAVLCGVLFDGCDLRGAHFNNAVLDGVDFGNSELEDADFRRAQLVPHITGAPGVFDRALMYDMVRDLVRSAS